MISKGRKKVLGVFMESPLDGFHLREISRRTGIAVNNTHRYLSQFIEKDFLLVKGKGNRKIFQLNFENDFLLKTMEYLEVERREKFFKKRPEMGKLRDVAREVRGLMKGVVMVLFDGKEGDVLVVVNGREHVVKSRVMRVMDLNTFRKSLDENLLKDRVVIYNEFRFWRMLSEF
ncbi:MAG: helix-turn-helix domain-containing protein [Candidatus Altiarchaeota archaeon]|nr:helix-turn-helix domain-containing protein [Candidatus Altiarchaeota archaeon]MBU4406997.1 helix-turn-helix domain-containing protein [Candidatus Altiarchaeota archaeon]